jgi:hypothetical protein
MIESTLLLLTKFVSELNLGILVLICIFLAIKKASEK